MFQDFQEQSLNEPWNLKLEDYLPRPEPQSRVPLPPQPQPNPDAKTYSYDDWLDTC